MLGLSQDPKNSRSKKKRTFSQRQEGQLQAFGDINSLFFSNEDCFSLEEPTQQRNRFKPFERDPDCEVIAGFQPIVIDPQLLKEFQHSCEFEAHQSPYFTRREEEISKQTSLDASRYRKDQINDHIQLLISQKRINQQNEQFVPNNEQYNQPQHILMRVNPKMPEDKVKLIQDQLYSYYNQINKF